MLKSTFIWSELYRFAPVTVERCACVWMLNGARAQLRAGLAKQVWSELNDAECPIEEKESLDSVVEKSIDQIMAHLDDMHKSERRIVMGTMITSGVFLTLQPWLALNFFSLPLTLAGAMLLGLEFSPRTGVGFVGMVKRFKEGYGSNKS